MITLTQGLADLSKELGESTTNTGTRRIQHYNDAIQEFANERKWKFLVKLDETLDTVAAAHEAIDISDIEDLRMPGGIKEITVAGETDPFLPIDFDKRNQADGRNRFYITPDEQSLKFTKSMTAGQTISMWYYYIPERIEATDSVETFPIPTR